MNGTKLKFTWTFKICKAMWEKLVELTQEEVRNFSI